MGNEIQCGVVAAWQSKPYSDPAPDVLAGVPVPDAVWLCQDISGTVAGTDESIRALFTGLGYSVSW